MNMSEENSVISSASKSYDISSPSSFSSNSAVPVEFVVTGGTSESPVKFAVNS